MYIVRLFAIKHSRIKATTEITIRTPHKGMAFLA